MIRIPAGVYLFDGKVSHCNGKCFLALPLTVSRACSLATLALPIGPMAYAVRFESLMQLSLSAKFPLRQLRLVIMGLGVLIWPFCLPEGAELSFTTVLFSACPRRWALLPGEASQRGASGLLHLLCISQRAVKLTFLVACAQCKTEAAGDWLKLLPTWGRG